MIFNMKLVFLTALVIWTNGYKVFGEMTTREPSLQAYGLPKRFLTGNGYIERVPIGGTMGSKESQNRDISGRSPNIRSKFQPKPSINGDDNSGVIEIFHIDSGRSDNVLSRRNTRSIDGENEVHLGNDLMGAESKVFRPLFVYRQQMAKRKQKSDHKKKVKHSKTPTNRNYIRFYRPSRFNY